jgi:hypothetical protein
VNCSWIEVEKKEGSGKNLVLLLGSEKDVQKVMKTLKEFVQKHGLRIDVEV